LDFPLVIRAAWPKRHRSFTATSCSFVDLIGPNFSMSNREGFGSGWAGIELGEVNDRGVNEDFQQSSAA
jgi:hypothetical protein